MTTRSIKILVIVFLTILVATAVLILRNNVDQKERPLAKPQQNIPADLKHYSMYLSQQKQLWTLGIKEDPQKAYNAFVATTNKLSFDMQHALSHEFGALLFRLKGENGVAFCDPSFSYGCYHGFFGQAVEVEGFKNIYSLDKVCARIKNSNSCQHGLGHAILVYYKTNDHINEALGVCAKLKNYGPYGGCLNGIFMEYNYSNLRKSPGSPRLLTDDNAYTPCSSIPEKFKESCYFFQAAWWKQANFSANSDYLTVGKLCASLSEEKLRKACFLGAGNLSGALSQYKMKDGLNACSQMPTLHGKVYCQMGLRWMFMSDSKHKNEADKACDGLAANEMKICKNEAHFKD